ncbi:MAG TPA: potassium-transporting ATPase subunit KdpA [Haliscomenobacter sp.]|uniref:potassium-transporting ATPase subunit KdpA n=1 Tax=Haliscomenobacter sp. TaxID=2717303 RepID=UPI002C12D195|nr:potassium-transporting ATPase subunit KdpA [Haliscomenobacter sp.]HOY16316.1 potassium-transporting ATPase subunit KdpA [Haliscomenobacter sp.]
MNTNLTGVVATLILTILLAIPLGRYLAKVYQGERVWTDFLRPFERLLYRLGGINPAEEMSWQRFIRALLTINMLWLVYGFIMLFYQGVLPLNPDGNPGMTPDLTFNTVISFVVNCNLQHYSGESGLSYLSQVGVVMYFQFVSAATGMAALAGVYRAMQEKQSSTLGNFYVYFIQSITRILLPLSIVLAVALLACGTPMTFDGKIVLNTLQGVEQSISQGPAAAMIAIKQLGTNGGGFFGVNSAHPLENPNFLSNMLQTISILIIPIAMVFALGYYLKRRRLAWIIFGVMTLGFLSFVIGTIMAETAGNPAIDQMGINQDLGSMEGKETRIGAEASALWGIATTATSNGSVNAMHDSMTPISGFLQLLDMMINALYGGVGVGLLNYYIFIIIAVFISGLMVGRTPELLGKKVEIREMKIATLITLLHPFLILVGTALSSYMIVNHADIAWAVKPANWLNNPGNHGFSEMLYEYTSASANNGSGFEGLGDNNFFWNVSTGFVLILSRFLPIIGPVAIAGLLAQKQYIPESSGTLRVDTPTFGLMTFAVIFIVAALSFFPALALGPLAEYFSMHP